MDLQNREERLSRLESFTRNSKLIHSKPSVKKIICEMREIWEELKTSGRWIECSEKLPEKYTDVPIQIVEGDETYSRVGRLNHQGVWELSSYQNCKAQYVSTHVIRWFKVPPTPRK